MLMFTNVNIKFTILVKFYSFYHKLHFLANFEIQKYEFLKKKLNNLKTEKTQVMAFVA